MDIYGEIAKKLKVITGTDQYRIPFFTAEVKKVEGETCTVEIDKLMISGVRLNTMMDGGTEKLLVVPKIGSKVLVCDLSGGEYRSLAVIGYSKVESVEINIGTGEFKLKENELSYNGKVTFNGGELSGMVKGKDLLAWMQNVVIDLENLATKLKALPIVTKVPEKASDLLNENILQ